MIIAREIPEDVTVERVMYTQHTTEKDGDGPDAETERYLFELRPLVHERLNRLPYRRDRLATPSRHAIYLESSAAPTGRARQIRDCS